MSGILAEFVEKIISLKDPTIIEVAGQQYANQEFARIKPHVDRPSMYEVTGLASIVQLLGRESRESAASPLSGWPAMTGCTSVRATGQT